VLHCWYLPDWLQALEFYFSYFSCPLFSFIFSVIFVNVSFGKLDQYPQFRMPSVFVCLQSLRMLRSHVLVYTETLGCVIQPHERLVCCAGQTDRHSRPRRQLSTIWPTEILPVITSTTATCPPGSDRTDRPRHTLKVYLVTQLARLCFHSTKGPVIIASPA